MPSEPPTLPAYVGERAEAKGIDLRLTWEAFRGHHSTTRWGSTGAMRGAWSKWVVTQIGFGVVGTSKTTTDAWGAL